MKAIETVYKGYKFRSRLEARWAVLFDEGKIKWEYETEGFELPDGTRYLPDFYLPDYDWYVEVKPPRKGAVDDIIRASKFVGDKIKVLLLLGNIPEKTDVDLYHYRALYKNTLTDDIVAGSVMLLPWAEDNECTKFCLHFEACFCVDWRAAERIWESEKNITNDILIAKHDREMYEHFWWTDGQDAQNDPDLFAFCNTYLEDSSVDFRNFLNGCYGKARQARFEHGETPDEERPNAKRR